jgi:hypothetical protein
VEARLELAQIVTYAAPSDLPIGGC